jgi:hypothetical protein
MILYHYTNAVGLQGILASKSLWMSDYRFLNDTSEFHYGRNFVAEAIRRFEVDLKAISVEAWRLLESLRSKSTPSGVVALVGSLSTEGDLLSQWRGYNGGKGFSVGINADWLTQNADAQGFSLFPIRYKQDEQNTSADEAVRLLLSMLEDHLRGDPTRVSEVVTKWWQRALEVALAFKNEHFREECEYRLASIGQGWPTGVQVRPSSAGLVPYLPCQLDKVMINNRVFPPNNFGIERIIVGPALRDQQIFAVHALRAFHRMNFEVVKSVIAYVSD